MAVVGQGAVNNDYRGVDRPISPHGAPNGSLFGPILTALSVRYSDVTWLLTIFMRLLANT